MKAEFHLLFSFLLAIVFIIIANQYQLINLKSGQPLYLAGLIVLAGVFVDLDHLLDFWLSRPDIFFSIKAFLNTEYFINQVNKKIFVLLHSWEIALALFIVLCYLNWPLWFLALWLGIFWHLVLDHLFNKTVSTFGYFLLYRFVKKFRVLRPS